MLKVFAIFGLAAAMLISSASAFAASGNSSSYGTDGSGPTVPRQSLTPLSAFMESRQRKQRARARQSFLDAPPHVDPYHRGSAW
jgi:hypothetical protein